MPTSVPSALGAVHLPVQLAHHDIDMLEALTRMANRSEGREPGARQFTPTELASQLLTETIQNEYIEMERQRRMTPRPTATRRPRRFERTAPTPEHVAGDTGAAPD